MHEKGTQQRVGEILKDFSEAALKYERCEIDFEQLRGLATTDRLSELVTSRPIEMAGRPSDKLSTQEMSETNLQILRDAVTSIVRKLLDPAIDPAEEMSLIVFNVFEQLLPYIPESESDKFAGFVALRHDRCLIADIPDEARRNSELDILRNRIRKAAADYLQGHYDIE